MARAIRPTPWVDDGLPVEEHSDEGYAARIIENYAAVVEEKDRKPAR